MRLRCGIEDTIWSASQRVWYESRCPMRCVMKNSRHTGAKIDSERVYSWSEKNLFVVYAFFIVFCAPFGAFLLSQQNTTSIADYRPVLTASC